MPTLVQLGPDKYRVRFYQTRISQGKKYIFQRAKVFSSKLEAAQWIQQVQEELDEGESQPTPLLSRFKVVKYDEIREVMDQYIARHGLTEDITSRYINTRRQSLADFGKRIFQIMSLEETHE